MVAVSMVLSAEKMEADGERDSGDKRFISQPYLLL